MSYQPDWIDRMCERSEKRMTLGVALPIAVAGSAVVLGGLAFRTAALPYPTKNLGGYATAQMLLPSGMAGPGLAESIKSMGGPLSASLAITSGICGLVLLVGWLCE